MRKTLAIALISIHLAGNTELGQLLKLPQLVHHFFQHKLIDPDLSFFSFIIMHYAGDDGTHADDAFDKQLPCHSGNMHTIITVFSPMVKEVTASNPLVTHNEIFIISPVTKVLSKHVLLILQPPKAA